MNKKSVMSSMGFLLLVVVGVVAGIQGGAYLVKIIRENNRNASIVLWMIIFFACFAAAYAIQVVLRHIGRMIGCGRSGYTWVSFRLLSIIWQKRNGKIERKIFPSNGLTVNSILSPPDMTNESFPYGIYFLSGPCMNLLTSGIFFLIFYLLPQLPLLIRLTCLSMTVSGLVMIIIHVFPYKWTDIASDGYIFLQINKNSKARKAFWLQLQIIAKQAEGVRLRDMPPQWFYVPSDEDQKNFLVSNQALYCFFYLLDKDDLKKAQALGEHLLRGQRKIPETMKNEIYCEILFAEILGACRKEKIEQYFTLELKKHIKNTISMASRQRLLYAYEKIYLKDEALAKETLRTFEKICSAYPNDGESMAEREWVERIDKKVLQSNV